ncbi:hypothetical protein CC1G_14659 [Coprinopsis cinerea okayama7|uniref:Uncharacterized protein n=1 Tax=Coprinopsis cinerea (strain Okayama-7 / 130 / ATCC MYA-4618 / FGSC 9003) TaxID=240176 RepID=D6RMJ7_COPC7|nr:hypothetical protein CC1G_14659 [Coprinopsis cinerea okayama7\|eukprot:XP_002911230.1 hypothetical protein CC1G_14659 [Coprinopsis cinerea okayama7\
MTAPVQAWTTAYTILPRPHATAPTALKQQHVHGNFGACFDSRYYEGGFLEGQVDIVSINNVSCRGGNTDFCNEATAAMLGRLPAALEEHHPGHHPLRTMLYGLRAPILWHPPPATSNGRGLHQASGRFPLFIDQSYPFFCPCGYPLALRLSCCPLLHLTPGTVGNGFQCGGSGQAVHYRSSSASNRLFCELRAGH